MVAKARPNLCIAVSFFYLSVTEKLCGCIISVVNDVVDDAGSETDKDMTMMIWSRRKMRRS